MSDIAPTTGETATDPTPVVVAPPTTPDKPKTYESPAELFKEILDRAGLTDDAGNPIYPLDVTDRVVWLDPESKGVLAFDLRADCPLDQKTNPSQVAGIFVDEDEVRVYTLPKDKGFIRRYTLSKRGVGFTRSLLTNLEVFIDAMADEYAAQAGLDDDDEPDEPAS
jgi:hypothetical protein